MKRLLTSEIKNNGIMKINNFLNENEIFKISQIIKYYSAPKNTPNSYFPVNYKSCILKILKFKFINFFHSYELLKLNKNKELNILANNFFENKSKLSYIDAYYSKKSKQDVLPWHTDQAYAGKRDVLVFNHPDKFFLKIFIYLTDVDPDNGCMSYLPSSHKIGYAIRKAIFEKHIDYQPYWSLRDFKKIVLNNRKYFENYFKTSEVIENFFKQTEIIERDTNKKEFGYSAKAGSAIIFDEGGIHKGSRPQKTDRMVLRYLYSKLN
jgi:hypothetical protein